MSKIQWTNLTWNTLAGCTRTGVECDFCYAAAMSLRLEAMVRKDMGDDRDPGAKRKYTGVVVRTRRGDAAFTGEVVVDWKSLEKPLPTGARMIFVNSMSDTFHHNAPDKYLSALFRIMEAHPQHTFQVLTKRPERAAHWAGKAYSDGLPGHIWIGTSVGTQDSADERIPELLKVNARVRFLSCEPLLGAMDLRGPRYKHPNGIRSGVVADGVRGVDWVIVGCESGPKRRFMDMEWARTIVYQCGQVGVPAFVKQLPDEDGRVLHEIDEFPEDLRIREFPNV